MSKEWTLKRHLRSVKELRLWQGNPRLDPEQDYKYLRDYFDNISSDQPDRQNFMNLIKSIAEKGFIQIDPIVTYKQNDNLIVVEGNRRVLALKLLLEPNKAPAKYRKQICNLAKMIADKNSISKIQVMIAPSFDDTVWYINERNSISTLKQSWSRIQQHQWYYDEYIRKNKDIDKVAKEFNMTKGELENIIRFVKIRNLIKTEDCIKQILTNKEYENATSINFPITILERFFNSVTVQEKWGINFDGENLIIKNNKDFIKAFAHLIKNIVSENPVIAINTRTLTSNLNEILDKLPKIDTSIDDSNNISINSEKVPIIKPNNIIPIDTKNNQNSENTSIDDLARNRIIVGYRINTKSHRLLSVFQELKNIPTQRYPNAVAALLRVLLDLSVTEYINNNSLENTERKTLKEKLVEINKEFNNKTIHQLLNPNNEYSIDSLNMYIHDIKNINFNVDFLNNFFNKLAPILEILINMKRE